MGRILDRHTGRRGERAASRWPLALAGQPRPGGNEFSSTPPRPSAAVLTGVVHLNATHIYASRDRAARTRRPDALEEMCGSCGSRAVSSSGPWSQYSCVWRLARCSGTPARRILTVLPAGDTRTEVRPLRGTGPCNRRRVLDSPGPSALAPSRLQAVSAAVRGAPAASLRAVGGSHVSPEVPSQSGDETADPGRGLVPQWHVCVSPPRSVEG